MPTSLGKSLVVAASLACCLSVAPIAAGQQGNNAVYTSGSACCQASPAFIDASVFASTHGPNICAVLNFILQTVDQPPVYPSGAVIDARGLNSGNTSMTCTTTNPSPWAGITNPPPSTILLPATGGTKQIEELTDVYSFLIWQLGVEA